MSEDQYRRFIAHQHSLADAYVGVRLDDLCERDGLRRGVWRLPATAHAARARNALHTHNGDHHDNAE